MLKELLNYLNTEKTRLLKAREFIGSFYKQIFSSIVSLRESLFKHSFNSDNDWRELLNENAISLNIQDYSLQSTEGRIQNNSDYILNVLNNITVIEKLYLSNLEGLKLSDFRQIRAVNDDIWNFVKRLYIKDNFTFLNGQGYELALSIKANIKQRLENNITPFIDYLETIVLDEYRVLLRPALKEIVGVYKNYIDSPAAFDLRIKAHCTEIGLDYNQEVILGIIADLSKEDETFSKDIKARYKNMEDSADKVNIVRLKEIAGRFISQINNIQKLEAFVETVQKTFQPLTVLERIINFFKKLFTGKEVISFKHDYRFYYSSREGKLVKKYSSIKGLHREISQFNSFLGKFKTTMDFYGYTKNVNAQGIKEVENIIDNCISEFTNIYDQGMGLKEWILSDKNKNYLEKIPEKKQEEFNKILLSINYALIINKQYIRDMEKK